MNIVRSVLAVLIGILAIPQTRATVITFDGLASGAQVTNQFSGQGVQISLVGEVGTGPTVVAATDTDGVYTASYGAPGNFAIPGTTPQGEIRDVRFSFSSPIDFFSVVLLDAEETFILSVSIGGVPVALASISEFLGFFPNLVPSGELAVGQVRRASIGMIGGALFDEVVLDLTNGPGASTPESVTAGGPEYFDNVAFNIVNGTIPNPAVLALLGIGLAGLTLSRRGRSISTY